jgi:uroporphyrinogen decarboxylase
MNQLERFRATVGRRPHSGFLFHAGFTEDLDRRLREDCGLGPQDDLAEHFGMFQPRNVGLRPPAELPKHDFSHYYEDMEIPKGGWIDDRGVLNIPAGYYHFSRMVGPLRNARRFEDIEAFPYPTLEGYTADHMTGEVEAAHAEGKVAGGWAGHMFEEAWQIRGLEEFLTDMVAQPEWAEHILDKLTERNVAAARAAARAGVDYLTSGDDVATQSALMFSPDLWRRFIKARWAKVYGAAREIKPDVDIWYHSDGNVAAIIPELIEIGVTILNPVQPECLDPIEVQRRYGDRLVLDGTIGTQTTMPFGAPEDVRRAVRRMAETVGRDGALILAPTHVLEPEVPLENIHAFVEAVHSLDGGPAS